jgi:hypothetical protein
MISVSLVGNSTAAAASSAPVAQPAQPDAWTTLSMLTPSGVAAMGAASVTAAQTDVPPPPPPPAYRDSSDTTLLMIGSLAILAALAALAVSHGDHGNGHAASPN